MGENKQGIEYIVPKPETIRTYSRKVCEALAVKLNDSTFLQPYVIRRLAEILEIAAQAQVKHLNRQQLVDTDEK